MSNGYVELRHEALPKPALVMRCTQCGSDVGIDGNRKALDRLRAQTYVCVECLAGVHLAVDPEPWIGDIG